MAKVYEFLADGFEEVEGMGPVTFCVAEEWM